MKAIPTARLRHQAGRAAFQALMLLFSLVAASVGVSLLAHRVAHSLQWLVRESRRLGAMDPDHPAAPASTNAGLNRR